MNHVRITAGTWRSSCPFHCPLTLLAQNFGGQGTTPTGFKCVPNAVKDHENSGSPTGSLLPQIPKRRFTKRDGSKVAKLVILAGNAVRNADLHRAMELIEEIRVICESVPASGTSLQVVR